MKKSPNIILICLPVQDIITLSIHVSDLSMDHSDLESVAREQLGLLGNTEQAEVSDQGETDRGDQQPAGAVARYNTLM